MTYCYSQLTKTNEGDLQSYRRRLGIRIIVGKVVAADSTEQNNVNIPVIISWFNVLLLVYEIPQSKIFIIVN